MYMLFLFLPFCAVRCLASLSILRWTKLLWCFYSTRKTIPGYIYQVYVFTQEQNMLFSKKSLSAVDNKQNMPSHAAGKYIALSRDIKISFSPLGNPVAAARASLLRGQGRHTVPPPSGSSSLDWGERLPASAPVGGASEVSSLLVVKPTQRAIREVLVELYASVQAL